MELKTGKQLLAEYNRQENVIGKFVTLEEMIDQELERAKSFPLDKPVKPANGDIMIDLLNNEEKYYKDLLKEDYKNRDYFGCMVCQIKLNFITDLQKSLVSRLSV